MAEQTVMLDSNEVIKVVLPLKRFRLSECHTLGITNEVHTPQYTIVYHSIPQYTIVYHSIP